MTRTNTTPERRRAIARVMMAVAFGLMVAASASAADGRKEVRLDVAPGGTVNIVNNYGSVNLKPENGRQIVLAYTTHSGKVEADQESTPDKRRIEIMTHALPDQSPSADEARVDYEISVPAGISVTVTTATAPITLDTLSGDINLSSDTGQVTVRNVSRSHVHVRSVAGAITLDNVTGGHVEISSTSGTVQMVNVTGPKVNVGTGSGNITYEGDCSGFGDYTMTTHSGNIEMKLPQTASVDLVARSVSGSVQNDFPLQKKTHASFVPKAGSSFAGTSNSGSSSVQLQSFSGRIRVKKQ
ncbi:MAG TPA: DUF4097 family beta strand repeat-containing protein [Candidatus Limnocylindrales bacterium]|nr:DUF4097 family beta strand repeat-containing protein [Candidatus Limnocylindrales bacterium]